MNWEIFADSRFWNIVNAVMVVGGLSSAALIWRHARPRVGKDRALLWAAVGFFLFPIGPLAYLFFEARGAQQS